jgi:XapX domain-containing protein
MGNYILGVVVALALGAFCRWIGIPVPAPPSIYGALLILAITLGYLAVDAAMRSR